MKVKIGLLGRIIIAIALGVLLGSFVPEMFVRVFATFNTVFGEFINFAVPLIIIGFIAPAIAEFGKGSGKLLGMATAIAYTSTIIAGFLAYTVASNVLPSIVSSQAGDVKEPGAGMATTYFDIGIEPMMGVMTALVFAFVMGIGMAAIKGDVLQRGFTELKAIIEKVINFVIIPLLPFHIFGIFLNMTYAGEVKQIFTSVD